MSGAFIFVSFYGSGHRAVRLTVWMRSFVLEGMDFQIVGIRFIHSCILIHQAPAAAVYDTWVISNFSCYFCILTKTMKTVLLGYSWYRDQIYRIYCSSSLFMTFFSFAHKVRLISSYLPCEIRHIVDLSTPLRSARDDRSGSCLPFI